MKRPNNTSGNSPDISGHNTTRIDAPDISSTSIPVSFGHKPVEKPDRFDSKEPLFDTYTSQSSNSSQSSNGPTHPVETEHSDNSEPVKDNEPYQEPKPYKESADVQVDKRPDFHEEPDDQAPIFDSPDTKLEKPSDNTEGQKGAGLDLSGLSDDDAKDLGIQKPVPENVEIPRSALSANKPKNSNLSTFIVVAILVALALIAGAGYGYMKTRNKDTKSTSSLAPAPETKKTTTEVKAAEVDKTSTAIDTSLSNIDDTKDFAATDLSDTSLGLQ